MKNCTITLVFLAFAAAVVMGQDFESRKKIVKECKDKVHATDADIEELKKHIPPTTRTGQCLLACIEKAFGCMNADNSANVEKIKKFLEPLKEKNPDRYNKIVKIIEECKAAEKPEADECVAAKNFAVCVHSKKQAAGLVKP